jgi:hypothetical protein
MPQSKWDQPSSFPCDYRGLVPSDLHAGSAGRPNVPPLGLDQDFGCWVFVCVGRHPGAPADADVPTGPLAAGIEESSFARHAGDLSPGPETCLRFPRTTLLLNLVFLAVTFPLAFKIGSQFMPPLFEGATLYMPTALPGISIGLATQLL